MQFHVEVLKSRPHFREIQDFKAVNSGALLNLLENNVRLNSVFSLECPDKVMEIIIEEFNKAINSLAPSRVVQVRKTDMPYMNQDKKY